MSKPEIKDAIGGYEFTWEQEKLKIKVSRLRVHTSDGRVTGELLITSPAEGNRPIYPQTHLNFNSEQTRTRLAKTLESQDSRWKWQEIINQLSLAVIDRARQGEPVRELWTSDEIQAPEFLLEPVLYKGLPTIVFGEKAVCKSTLSLAIYASLILPWHDNPLGWSVPASVPSPGTRVGTLVQTPVPCPGTLLGTLPDSVSSPLSAICSKVSLRPTILPNTIRFPRHLQHVIRPLCVRRHHRIRKGRSAQLAGVDGLHRVGHTERQEVRGADAPPIGHILDVLLPLRCRKGNRELAAGSPDLVRRALCLPRRFSFPL